MSIVESVLSRFLPDVLYSLTHCPFFLSKKFLAVVVQCSTTFLLYAVILSPFRIRVPKRSCGVLLEVFINNLLFLSRTTMSIRYLTAQLAQQVPKRLSLPVGYKLIQAMYRSMRSL